MSHYVICVTNTLINGPAAFSSCRSPVASQWSSTFMSMIIRIRMSSRTTNTSAFLAIRTRGFSISAPPSSRSALGPSPAAAFSSSFSAPLSQQHPDIIMHAYPDLQNHTRIRTRIRIPGPLSFAAHRPFCDESRHRDEDPELRAMFAANREWVDSMNRQDPTYFTELGKGQSPNFLYIGCSDSRVEVSRLTGVGPGKIFIHRNIANLVVASDLNLLSVLTYAVAHLHVRHILVTGHYDCGGVRAAMRGQSLGLLDAWLQNIRDVYRLHKEELDAIPDEELRHRRLVELNVVEQCLNLYKTSVVQQKRIETHKDGIHPFAFPRVHGLVFNPANGILKKLPINFREKITQLRNMYDLFEFDSDEPNSPSTQNTNHTTSTNNTDEDSSTTTITTSKN